MSSAEYLNEHHDKLRAICVPLTNLGITMVSIDYSGWGDEGAVHHITCEPVDVTLPDDLHALVEEWTFEILPAGWVNDEGSEGTVTIDVAKSKAHVAHGWCVTEADPYEIG